MSAENGFLRLAARSDVVARAARTAGLVGLILIAINHGDVLVSGGVGAVQLGKMVLTVLVPYCVSTYASVRALQSAAGAGPHR
ncbi:MAG: phosphoenolpyruvate protein kinase [Pseudomonadales bacterium]|nr:phosphoenolpyruvate protein kinase [Pseudomonadales bacterium]NIX08441.1 phosphoenolpyruvate protein kinase [Pseudomonadales bacterium]